MKSHVETNPETAAPVSGAEPTSVAVAKFLANGFLPDSVTVEALDRVRWSHMTWSGKCDGPYEEHVSAAEVRDRAAAVAQIRKALDKLPGPVNGREGFGDGATYAELFLTTVASVLARDYKPRTRASKAAPSTSTSEGI